MMIGRVVSHYTVLERLGAGGMGVVYKAIDSRLGRHVALKFLSPELHRDENSKRRFIHEAKAASALDHPNICTIYEIDETEDDYIFIAMAFYEGETLKKRLQETELPLGSCIHVATQTANGLSKAHTLGIVHRDIKPANLILTRDQTVKILDFGLAKLTGQTELTGRGSAVGTAAYMSPEQAQGFPVDFRTDIWSWGVVLYEMLTGQMPFNGENHLSLFHSIVKQDPTRVSAVRNDLSSVFDRIIAKALEKNPEKRYFSIAEASEDLQRAHSSMEISIFSTAAQTIVPESRKREALKLEKKQLTILKSQLTQYAELLESLSPSDLRSFLNRIHEEVAAIAKRAGGVINDFSGEEWTILFGIPSSDEHDFLRAAEAAFSVHAAIRKAASECVSHLRFEILAQSGIATGLLVVHLSESSDRKYELSGNAIQLASALASNAEPGEIWITEEGRRMVDLSFQTESCEKIRLKGKSRKLQPYRIVSELQQSRFDIWQKERLTPYAGRENELQILQTKLQTSLRGEGQFVAVIGEAGSGKSRLLYEFLGQLDPNDLRILQGGSRLYEGNVAYSPFIEVLKEELRLREKSNSEQTAIEAIRELNESLLDFLPVYLHLLAIPSTQYPLPRHLQGKELQAAITEALCAYILSRKRHGILLLLEDWHAADEASQNILEQLQEMIPNYPILIVVTCRPECSFRAAAHHTIVYLKSLDAESAAIVMKAALQAENVPARLVHFIVERTGGNPFFIEEICQTMREEGLVKVEKREAIPTQTVDHFRLPETIQSVIGCRLDRIEPEARSLLEIASVIGREFQRSLLLKLAGNEVKLLHSLDVLKELGLIQQLRVLPEASYKFKHPLMQETAYAGLLGHERKKLHGEVGAAMEELYVDRLEEHLDVLAYHFSIAERWEKAVRYGRDAVRKATAIGDFAVALRQLQQVEEWLSNSEQNEQTARLKIELLLDQERLCETLGIRNRQEEILNSLIAKLTQSNDHGLLLEVYRRLGELYTVIAKFAEAETALNESLRLSIDLQDLAGQANAQRSKGFLYWNQGRNEEAIASNEAALEIDRKRNDTDGIARDLLNLTAIFRGVGRTAEALECAEEAYKHFSKGTDPVKIVTTLHWLGNVHRDRAEIDRAIDYLKQALEISSKNHLTVLKSFHLTGLANLYSLQGKVDDSLKLLEQCVDLCRKSGYAEGLAHSLRSAGEVLLNSKQEQKALPRFEEAAALFLKVQDAPSAALCFSTIGSIHEMAGRIPDSIEAWKKVKDLREKLNDQSGLLTSLETLGRVTRQQEDYVSSADYYNQAAGLATKPESRASLLYTLGILQWKRQDFSGAIDYFHSALTLFEQVGDKVHAGLMMNSIGASLKIMGKKEQAMEILKQAVKLNHETNERLLEGHGLSLLGEVLHESGELQEAAECFSKSLAIRKDIGDRKGEAWMIYQLGMVFAAQKKESQATESFSEARRIAEECGDSELILALRSAQ